jgi:hypothetical protein
MLPPPAPAHAPALGGRAARGLDRLLLDLPEAAAARLQALIVQHSLPHRAVALDGQEVVLAGRRGDAGALRCGARQQQPCGRGGGRGAAAALAPAAAKPPTAGFACDEAFCCVWLALVACTCGRFGLLVPRTPHPAPTAHKKGVCVCGRLMPHSHSVVAQSALRGSCGIAKRAPVVLRGPSICAVCLTCAIIGPLLVGLPHSGEPRAQVQTAERSRRRL